MAIEYRPEGKPVETKYAGLVVHAHRAYLYDELYTCYATVWHPERGAFETIGYDGGYPEHLRNHATVDAPVEILAKYAEALDLKETLERAGRACRDADAAIRIEHGRAIKVVRGRKVPKGTRGEIFWLGETMYGMRVGLKDAEGTVHWTAMGNVEVEVMGDEAADLYDLHLAWLTAKAAVDAVWYVAPPATWTGKAVAA